MTVDPIAYAVRINKIIEPNVRLIRVRPNDLAITFGFILKSLSSLCWIGNMSAALRRGYEVRATKTINDMTTKFTQGNQDDIFRNAGEYIVSELTRSSIVNELNYMDIPLGELFKQKKSGNPGFDIFTVNLDNQILFGEAKYISKANAHNSAFTQVNRFINEERDQSDLPDLVTFGIEKAIENASHGNRGLLAGFSSTSIPDEDLESLIKANKAYSLLPKNNELICVAVDLP